MGRKKLDIVNKRFGMLIVVKFSHIDHNRASCWSVKCDCGKIKTVCGGLLQSGHTKSCGCLRKEIITKHGMYGTPTYNSWNAMKQRCYNPKRKQFKDYGGRGIKVCERWFDFNNFLADMGIKPCRMTLDRINNDDNYEPENCKWATYEEQSKNKRRWGACK